MLACVRVGTDRWALTCAFECEQSVARSFKSFAVVHCCWQCPQKHRTYSQSRSVTSGSPRCKTHAHKRVHTVMTNGHAATTSGHALNLPAPILLTAEAAARAGVWAA